MFMHTSHKALGLEMQENDHPQTRPVTPKASTETHGLIALPTTRQTKLLSPTNINVSKEICRIKPRIRP